MGTRRSVAVDRELDPAGWERWAASDDPIVTQWDDGAHEGTEPGASFSSSSSMPSLVFSMLGDLDVRPGQRVLEIGTGTGWNAALLAYRLGAANVVTVEVDGAVAARGRAGLERFGLPVEVVHGDGALGSPERAPFDRVIVTCGVRRIPGAWLEQTRPGGVVLLPWGTYYGVDEAIARLVVGSDGRSASGSFTRPVAFMRMRSQRFVWPRHDSYVPGPEAMDAAEISFTDVPEAAFRSAGFAIGLRVRHVAHNADRERDGRRAVWFYGLTDRSWAVVVFRDGSERAKVYQAGPRRLWDEVEGAFRWWDRHGRPGPERFGIAVRSEGPTAAWLDGARDAAWPV
ncbi:methyltransferase domain-containing protein [Streptomyces sp. NPDC050610]|uniref:methyltransferase domain-containing protein n=1 Tax=Streptomyces sp. NPDC050610 TaxID=3157097 RepID=UPI003427E5BD